MSLFLAHISSVCAVKKNFSKSCCCFSVCCFKPCGRKMQTHLDEKRGKTNERKILNSLSSFLDTKEHCWLLLRVTRKNTEYYSPRRVVPKEREREREMRKSSRGGVTTVLAKKKISSSFSHKRYHHRTPLGEINDDDEEDEQRVREKDSPMTVRRKWNKEHGVSCGGGNSPSSARFKATAMDKVLILNRRVDTLEVRTILRLKCLPLLLELVTVFNLSFARDDVNVMSALN